MQGMLLEVSEPITNAAVQERIQAIKKLRTAEGEQQELVERERHLKLLASLQPVIQWWDNYIAEHIKAEAERGVRDETIFRFGSGEGMKLVLTVLLDLYKKRGFCVWDASESTTFAMWVRW